MSMPDVIELSSSDEDSDNGAPKRKKQHRDPAGKQERKRARKQREAEKLLLEKKERIRSAKKYLRRWKAMQDQERNIYDRKAIPKSLFADCALAYLCSTKGQSRERMREQAATIVRTISLDEKVSALEKEKEEKTAEEEKQKVESEIKRIRSKYKRAEKLVEQLAKSDTET
eukprot:CAMPEP_0184028842 /NCGR_PEP_ID=MMETSP0954-20121128/15082_1 /TAXON_ID=627963 /ORGANISM="Aplanochytrium sp, Strain PBS07" /LENGTH=170 /DNA_ID=CAMNT_0026313765 /DNA_START=44 /DNA_END=556 /DNA_ORIENTATION=+